MTVPLPNIAMLIPEYRTEHGAMGGVTTVADFLYDELIGAGWSVTRFTPRMSRRATESRRILSPASWFQRLRLYARPDGVIAVGAHIAELEAARYLPRRALDIELRKYDAVLVVAGSPALSLIAARSGKPVVLQVATMIRQERQRLMKSTPWPRRMVQKIGLSVADAQDRLAIRRATVIVTENRWMNDQCLAHGASRVELAPPGVDTDIFSPTTYADSGPLVMVARLGDPRKDFPTLFRAYKHARTKGLKAPLVVAGRGALSRDDASLLDELELRDFVSIKADLAQDQLVELLRSAALFVTSSSEEGLGLSILEAMACGLPVVSTATEGARFILEDGDSGQLVPIGQPETLGSTLVDWISSPDRRRTSSKAARQRVLATFSTSVTGTEFRRILRDAIPKDGGQS